MWVWGISIILLMGCTNPKNLQPTNNILSTPTKTEATFFATPSQSAPITALPQNLIFVQKCEIKEDASAEKPCPDSVFFNDSNGNFKQFPFIGSNLTLAYDYKKGTFEHDRDIWLLDLANGTSKNLTNTTDCYEHDVTWSPDSKSIAFLGCGGDSLDDIYLLDILSGKRTNITNTPDRYENCFPSNSFPLSNCSLGWWSKQSSLIVSGSGNPRKSQPGEIWRGACHTYAGECFTFPTKISIDGKGYSILDQINGLEYLPALSPDGTLLAYDGGILYNVATGTQTTLHPSDYGLSVEASNDSGDPQLVSPSWSPDGKQIAWIGHINNNGDNGLFVFDISRHEGQILATYRPYYVTLTLPPWSTWSGSIVRWSPDSQWITLSDLAWTEQKNPSSGTFLWVMSRDGKTKVKFDTGNYTYAAPVWSPDSQNIVFCQNHFVNSEFSQTIQMLEITTWKIKQLSVSGDSYPVAWFNP